MQCEDDPTISEDLHYGEVGVRWWDINSHLKWSSEDHEPCISGIKKRATQRWEHMQGYAYRLMGRKLSGAQI